MRCQNSGELMCVAQSKLGAGETRSRAAWSESPLSLRRQNRRTVPFIQPSR